MPRGRTALATTLACTALLTGVMNAAPATATPVPGTQAVSAWPEDCSYDIIAPRGGWAYCASGGGFYQVVVACYNIYAGRKYFYGKAVKPGFYSTKDCPADYTRSYVGINMSAS
ncbi:hypothetical protein OG474_01975 [Kribbella sp. NBC_01505]|uniref:hypothetical protein n=1 Tax=Kribbella sp. NBC_01505 TaxID=2903580 RepID=UPI00386507BA